MVRKLNRALQFTINKLWPYHRPYSTVYSLDKPRELSSHRVEHFQVRPRPKVCYRFAEQDPLQNALRPSHLKEEDKEGTIALQRTGVKDIRQGKWHSIFDEQPINRLDSSGDCGSSATSVGEPNEGSVNPVRIGRLDDVSESTVQEMKVVPCLLAVHLNVVEAKW